MWVDASELRNWSVIMEKGERNVCFSENLACFVFLKHPFWDSPFCLIADELKLIFLKFVTSNSTGLLLKRTSFLFMFVCHKEQFQNVSLSFTEIQSYKTLRNNMWEPSQHLLFHIQQWKIQEQWVKSCSKLTTNTPEGCHWRSSGAFIVYFGKI